MTHPKYSPNLILSAFTDAVNKDFVPYYGNKEGKKQISMHF